jgi:hypothetical protein
VFAPKIEGIARRTEEIIVAGSTETHDRAIGLAQDDSTRTLDPLGEQAIGVDDMVFECPDATEGALPSRLEIKKIFDRGRYTMERAEWIAAQHGLLGVASALASLVESEINEGVKAWGCAARSE